jgi:hypothetical protein
MSSKRAGSRSSTAATSVAPTSPLANALLLGVAISYALSLLVMGGRVRWPPHELLGSLYTVSGCLALVGPLVLWRAGANERALGELIWMMGGTLVWIFNIVAASRGTLRGSSWATPLAAESMGLMMLAVLIAGWRCQGVGRSWSWTNVLGWVLGVFWILLALVSILPTRLVTLGSR